MEDETAQSRPVIVVPETLSLDQMLGRFRAEKGALAVVIDEFGGTAGIVTFEDLMEEVIGEIQDEFDAERAPFEIVSERRLRVDGSLLLDELNQHFDIDYDEEEVDTVGGLIMSRLGRIPAVGDVVELNGVRYVVEQVAGRAVDSVLVELPEAGPVPADPENEDV